jgi:hypothetical protein
MPPDVPGGAGRSGRLADSTCCLAPAKPADTDPADCSRLRRLQPAPPAAAGRRRLAPAPRCTRPHLWSRRRLRRPACRPQDLLPHQPRPAPRGLHGARRTRPTTSSSTSEAAADTAADAARTRTSPLTSPPIQHVAACAEPESGDGIIGSRV